MHNLHLKVSVEASITESKLLFGPVNKDIFLIISNSEPLIRPKIFKMNKY